MNKLIVVIMGPGKKHFAEMCLNSVKDADEVLYWCSDREKLWGRLDDKVMFGHLLMADNDWDETDPATNGKCRQRYLEHLKENYPDDWALILDEDEVLDDNGIQKIKDFINDEDRQDGIYNVKMRHFIGDLGHEDATRPVHVVPARLFKISEAINYPLHSHPILEGELKGACLDTTIWHLGHLPVEYMDYILKRYKQHSNDSIIHPPEFLHNWKINHLFGVYPQRQINPVELPKQICDRYEIDKDYFYFMDRQNLEPKHYQDCIDWVNFFKPECIIEFGCGFGQRIRILNSLGINTFGFELSKYAVENSLSNHVFKGDILSKNNTDVMADLVIVYDVLEHLKYDKLKIAISNMKSHTNKYILVSVPFEGDPNLEADPTHIIKENKEWWIKQFTDKGLKLIPTPNHFLYKEQVMIFEK